MMSCRQWTLIGSSCAYLGKEGLWNAFLMSELNQKLILQLIIADLLSGLHMKQFCVIADGDILLYIHELHCFLFDSSDH